MNRLSTGMLILTLSIPCTSYTNPALNVGYGHLAARALHAASYYKIFDQLKDGAKDAIEIAEKTGLRADSLKSVLRVVANQKLIDMDDNGKFSLNAESQILLSDTPGSLQPAFAKEFDPKRWAAFGIYSTLTQGADEFKTLFGQTYYDYLEQNPESAKLFNAGMKAFSDAEDEELAQKFPFRNYGSYCDVGGGAGGLVKKVLAQAPEINATLFELESALVGVDIPGVALERGSFFDKVPAAELYTLKRVLHNWDDNESLVILSNARKSITNQKEGRILVIEKIIPKTIDYSLMIDSEIVALALGGKERSLEDFIALAKKAGLSYVESISLSRVSILVFKVA